MDLNKMNVHRGASSDLSPHLQRQTLAAALGFGLRSECVSGCSGVIVVVNLE